MNDIFNFLSPVHLNPLQFHFLPIFFFVVIWGLTVISLVSVWRNANEENWEDNWRGGDVNSSANDLDIGHGSVLELHEALATRTEKWADAMPGLILIIGLLGTFVGLGMALDKASSILTSADTVGDMSSSMTQLMGMLEGLGSKFKTSTWGLMAFILLKVAFDILGYEKKRLMWCISKVKGEIDSLRDKEVAAHKEANREIVNGLSGLSSALLAQREKHHDQALIYTKYIAKTFQSFSSNTSSHNVQVFGLLESIEKTNLKSSLQLGELSSVSLSLSGSAEKMSVSASSLGGVVDQLKGELNEVIHNLEKSLSTSVLDMSKNLNETTWQMSSSLSQATGNIQATLTSLKEQIKLSSAGQDQAVTSLKTMTDSLSVNVKKSTNAVEGLVKEINDNLKPISSAGLSIAASSKKQVDLVDQIKDFTNLVQKYVDQLNAQNTDDISKKKLQTIGSLLNGMTQVARAKADNER